MRPLALAAAFVPCLPGQTLAEQQLADGRWPELPRSAEALGAGLEPAAHPGDLRATAAALLADLAGGSTLKVGPRRDAIKRAVQWLRSQADPDTGRLRQGSFEDRALAGYALAASQALSNYRTLRPFAQRAIGDLLAEIEDPGRASRATPAARALLLLAMEAHGGFDAANHHALVRWFVDRPAAGHAAPVARDAAELLCRVVHEPDRAAADLAPIVDRLLSTRRSSPDELTLFLATTAFHRLGDPAWTAWTDRLAMWDAQPPAEALPIAPAALAAATLALRSGRSLRVAPAAMLFRVGEPPEKK